jgi:hypothetical protein
VAWGRREGSTRDEWIDDDGGLVEGGDDDAMQRWWGPLRAAVLVGRPEEMKEAEAEAFLEWMRMALRWLPEDGASAGELLRAEWLVRDWDRQEPECPSKPEMRPGR